MVGEGGRERGNEDPREISRKDKEIKDSATRDVRGRVKSKLDVL